MHNYNYIYNYNYNYKHDYNYIHKASEFSGAFSITLGVVVFMEELKELMPMASFCIAFLGFYLGRMSVSKDEGKQEATVLVELGHIKGQVTGLSEKMDRQETHYTEVMVRLTAVEESSKQAHLRITEIREHCCGD